MNVRLLALDTATENCSVALLLDSDLQVREEELGRGHAERVLGMIDALLAEAGVSLRSLDAVAFGRGPGAFTGVRLAASVTQGLAWGADLGVVPVSDLAAIAQRAFKDPSISHMLTVNDARMREVYWGGFERQVDGHALARPWGAEQVSPPDAVVLPAAAGGPVMGAGRGLAVYPGIIARLGLMPVQDTWLPCAREIAELAAPRVLRGELCAPEEALPVYLRDEVAHVRSR